MCPLMSSKISSICNCTWLHFSPMLSQFSSYVVFKHDIIWRQFTSRKPVSLHFVTIILYDCISTLSDSNGMSETSALVGVGCTIMLSNIFVATITAFPMLRQILIISSCILNWQCSECQRITQLYVLKVPMERSPTGDDIPSVSILLEVKYLQKWNLLNRELCTKISSCNHCLK